MTDSQTTLSFSEEFLQAASEVTLADFFRSETVQDRTLLQITRAFIFARQNLIKSSTVDHGDLEFVARLNKLRQLADQSLMDLAFASREANREQSETHHFHQPKQPTPPKKLPVATLPQTRKWLADWIESGKFARFRRSDAVGVVQDRGPFSNADKVPQMVDNALQDLQKGGVVLNLPSQKGTWVVQSALFIESEGAA